MVNTPGRILAVDPGERRLGLAVSDPTQTIASPLGVMDHQSRQTDAERILAAAEENEVVLIVIGRPLDWDGMENPQSQKSDRLAEVVRSLGSIPVELWDEFGSTQKAQQARREMNVSRKKRAGHLDDLAAVVILQSYLDRLENQEEY
jgi:putative Holliday junction resolvase